MFLWCFGVRVPVKAVCFDWSEGKQTGTVLGSTAQTWWISTGQSVSDTDEYLALVISTRILCRPLMSPLSADKVSAVAANGMAKTRILPCVTAQR